MHPTPKRDRPAFQSVELDSMDLRLEAKAAEKGIPTLVSPAVELAPSQRTETKAQRKTRSTPRAQMKKINVDIPDYAWIAVKTRAAQEMISVRHFIMSALRANGIEIKEADMIEDGRRLRGPQAAADL